MAGVGQESHPSAAPSISSFTIFSTILMASDGQEEQFSGIKESGFVWLKQKKRVDHYFAKAGRHVSYATEVSAIAEKGRLKKISGVKAKEMLIWVNLHEICVDDPPTGKLHCKAIGGLSRSFPVEAFEATDALPVPVTGRLKKKTEKESADQKDEKKKEEEAEKPKGAAVAPAPAAVDEIGQKMKEMNTEAPVQAEAVAAKN
ncbi:hypothetical protein TRIUR3_28272 [Triticum urartu]|uniref:Uncharacterized protein n=1 Tax=Triticum urartu TaxID=4572 RepID=M8ATZ6_TRIUA|nr:hypothetical protein TRIUR3_28272 [Triticum urartu]